MKRAYSITLMAVFMFSLSSHLFAEIYQWKDEHGKTHFGDREPETYNESVESINIPKTSTFEGRKPKPPPPAPVTVEKKSSDTTAKPARQVAPPKENKSKCETESAEYEASLVCFSKCRTVYGTINVAKCPECVSVTMPACYPEKKDKVDAPLVIQN